MGVIGMTRAVAWEGMRFGIKVNALAPAAFDTRLFSVFNPDGDAALRVSTLGVTVGAKAAYKDFVFTIGGAVVRNQTFVRFGGEHTQATIAGASLLKGKQHVDNTLMINHAAAHCAAN